jgi:propionyl-CoA synthetase
VLRNAARKTPDEVVSEVVVSVRNTIGPVASFKQAIVIKRLPKTRSGKILRGTMKKMADRRPYPMPATIDDPQVLSEIQAALEEWGRGQPKA